MQRIGPYKIEGTLDKGGMGVVYKAWHEALGRWVAIKKVLPERAADVNLRKRLAAEAKALGALRPHPNVVAVYDFIPESLAMVMEFVEGETLAQVLARKPGHRMSLAEALAIIKQLLDALQHIHEQKVVHRDIKPSNVMLSGDRVKVTDFGLALLAGEPRFTASRYVIGTPEYMSPEQLQGEELDHRTDIYSAALVLYQMLAGQPAFDGKVRDRLFGPSALQSLVPELPPGVSDAVSIALQADREDRFASAAEFRDALLAGAVGFLPAQRADEAVTPVMGEGEEAPPPVPPPPSEQSPHERGVWALLALLVGGFLVVATLLYYKARLPFSLPKVEHWVVVTKKPEPPPKREPVKKEPKPLPPKRLPPIVEDTVQVIPEGQSPQPSLQTDRAEVERLLMAVQSCLDKDKYPDFVRALRDLAVIESLVTRHGTEFDDVKPRLRELNDRANDLRKDEIARVESAKWDAEIAVIETLLKREPNLAGLHAQALAANPAAPDPIRLKAADLAKQALQNTRQGLAPTAVGQDKSKVMTTAPPPEKKP